MTSLLKAVSCKHLRLPASCQHLLPISKTCNLVVIQALLCMQFLFAIADEVPGHKDWCKENVIGEYEYFPHMHRVIQCINPCKQLPALKFLSSFQSFQTKFCFESSINCKILGIKSSDY